MKGCTVSGKKGSLAQEKESTRRHFRRKQQQQLLFESSKILQSICINFVSGEGEQECWFGEGGCHELSEKESGS